MNLPAHLELGCLALMLLGCAKEPKQLKVRAECKTTEVVACLQRYAYERLSNRDIERVATEGLSECLSQDKYTLGKQAECLPLEMGTDNLDRAIAIGYFCTDSCPEYGSAYIGFAKDMSQPECCGEGEIAFRNFAWGGYAGCRSRVATEAQRAKSGSKEPIHSLCGGQ